MPKTTLPKNAASGGNEALYGLISRLADNKYFLGRRYAEWCSSAPTLESSVAAAAMAQDELGHARALYPLLTTLAPDLGAELEPETRTNFHRLRFLDSDFDGWIDFATAFETSVMNDFADAGSNVWLTPDQIILSSCSE